jgi:hypothetical protein
MSKDREVRRCVIFPYAAFVFTKGNVEDPREAVLNTPMPSHGLCYFIGVALHACDVIAELHSGLAILITLSLRHHNSREIFPLFPLGQPVGTSSPVPWRLNSPMIAVDSLVIVMGNIQKVRCQAMLNPCRARPCATKDTHSVRDFCP